jgi:hypothetical protein
MHKQARTRWDVPLKRAQNALGLDCVHDEEAKRLFASLAPLHTCLHAHTCVRHVRATHTRAPAHTCTCAHSTTLKVQTAVAAAQMRTGAMPCCPGGRQQRRRHELGVIARLRAAIALRCAPREQRACFVQLGPKWAVPQGSALDRNAKQVAKKTPTEGPGQQGCQVRGMMHCDVMLV